ncbi:MAG: LytR C-terminal domain-containing protein, partial [Jiangellales bacterium]
TLVTSDVDVLNQTLTEGLAGRAARVVEQRGWRVERIDNATLGTPATTVYVPVGLEAAGEAFLQVFPEVTRTRPAFEGLAVDRLTLVLAEPDALGVVTAMEAAGVPAT